MEEYVITDENAEFIMLSVLNIPEFEIMYKHFFFEYAKGLLKSQFENLSWVDVEKLFYGSMSIKELVYYLMVVDFETFLRLHLFL